MKPFLAITLFVSLAGMASAEHPKMAHDLDDANPNAAIDVIVQFH